MERRRAQAGPAPQLPVRRRPGASNADPAVPQGVPRNVRNAALGHDRGRSYHLRDSSTAEQVETTVGIGLPGLELGVLDAKMRLQECGAGELVMRGPGVFNGYFGQTELYAEHLVGDGFFRTGDLARIDADRYVSITGRVKDLIVRGAVNISPVETENAIAAHPDVAGVAVIGWPDERLGERICAVVQTNAALDLEQVMAFCADQGPGSPVLARASRVG